MQSKGDKRYYDILHAARDADDNVLKKNFHKCALIYHPDKGGSDAEFQLLNEAYQVLSDNNKRAAYDAVSF